MIGAGIQAGEFAARSERRPFVMARFWPLHEVVTDPAGIEEAIHELDAFVRRGLGFDRHPNT